MRLARRSHFALLGGALFGAAIVLFATQQHGIGLSPDSAGYLSTARNIMRGQGINNFWDAPLVILAPLYAMLLGFLGWVSQIDPLVLAPLVNAILFGLIVYASGRVAFLFLKSPIWAFAATAAILFSPPLLFVAVMAWSETLFIFLTVLAFWVAKLYFDAPRLKTLLGLAAILALAMLARYVGIILSAWGLLLVFVASAAPRKQKFLHALLFLGIATAPLALWVLRNYLVSGTLFGERHSSIFTLPQNFNFTFRTLGHWFVPTLMVDQPVRLLFVGLGGGLFSVAALKGNLAAFKKFLYDAIPLLAYVVCYLGFIIFLATTTAFDPLGDRLLSPVYVPLVLLLFGFVDFGARAFRGIVTTRLVSIALTLIVLLWLAALANHTLGFAAQVRNGGSDFTSSRWRTSPTIAYLRAQPLPNDCALVSNNPAGLYLLTNLTAALSPLKGKYNSSEIVTAEIETLRGKWFRGDTACLVWFNELNQPYLFTLEELHTIANLRALATFPDGAIYLVTNQ